MGIKTEDFVNNLPPKEITEGIDWLGILDSFDPKTLDEKYLNECARRNPFYTCYNWDTPMPVMERLEHSEYHKRFDRNDLEDLVKRIEAEGLNASLYKNARMTLIKAIGSKSAHEYNLQEYDRLGEFGRKKQEKEYQHYLEEIENRRQADTEQQSDDLYYEDDYEDYVESVHEKIIRIRKGFKDSFGRPLTQRDFAKYLEYPINKYTEAEKIDKWGEEEESPVEDLLLERLIFRCHANPYWLYDPYCESFFGNEENDIEAVIVGDEPCIYASPDMILKWIKEGKPRITSWEDGIIWHD